MLPLAVAISSTSSITIGNSNSRLTGTDQVASLLNYTCFYMCLLS